MKTSLILFIFSLLLFVISSFSSTKTCWDNGNCVDLTEYESNQTIINDFWKECNQLFDDDWTNCSSYLESYNAYIEKEWTNDADVFAIWLYTGNAIYSTLNAQLRKGDNTSNEYYYTTLEIASGLFRLESGVNPSGLEIAWRGTFTPTNQTKYVVGELTTEPTFCSSSFTRSIGYGWSKNTLLVIAHTSGKKVDWVSQYPSEDEVLFSAGFQFYVLKIDNYTGGWYDGGQKVFMYEVNDLTVKYTDKQRAALLNKMIKADSTDSSSDVHMSHGAIKKSIIKKSDLVIKKKNTNEVPSSWVCDPLFYNSQDGCDCDCGAYDPDCDLPLPNGQLLHCLDGASPSCSSAGKCTYSAAPSSWSCDAYHYNSTDGCDCGCGAYDPDCDQENYGEYVMFNCKDGIPVGCDMKGECTYAPELPADWVCDPTWYATGDGCDCNCGAYDLDCEDSTQVVMNCPCGDMTCSMDGFCQGSCTSEDTGKQTQVVAGTQQEIEKSFNHKKEDTNSQNNVNGYYIASITVLVVINVALIVGFVALIRRRRENYAIIN